MDCDSKITNPNFLASYLKYTEKTNTLIYGGTSYQVELPKPEHVLHWKYGKERECITALERNKNKFGTFKTNNFFVPNLLFEKIKFDENITSYGHEDTLFALDIERNGFDIIHIENPLQHDGLEVNEVFIKKQHNAIRNLAKLFTQKLVGNEIRIIKFYNRLKSFGLIGLFKLIYLKNPSNLESNLKIENPNLRNLDKLKLFWLIEKLKKN